MDTQSFKSIWLQNKEIAAFISIISAVAFIAQYTLNFISQGVINRYLETHNLGSYEYTALKTLNAMTPNIFGFMIIVGCFLFGYVSMLASYQNNLKMQEKTWLKSYFPIWVRIPASVLCLVMLSPFSLRYDPTMHVVLNITILWLLLVLLITILGGFWVIIRVFGQLPWPGFEIFSQFKILYLLVDAFFWLCAISVISALLVGVSELYFSNKQIHFHSVFLVYMLSISILMVIKWALAPNRKYNNKLKGYNSYSFKVLVTLTGFVVIIGLAPVVQVCINANTTYNIGGYDAWVKGTSSKASQMLESINCKPSCNGGRICHVVLNTPKYALLSNGKYDASWLNKHQIRMLTVTKMACPFGATQKLA